MRLDEPDDDIGSCALPRRCPSASIPASCRRPSPRQGRSAADRAPWFSLSRQRPDPAGQFGDSDVEQQHVHPRFAGKAQIAPLDRGFNELPN